MHNTQDAPKQPIRKFDIKDMSIHDLERYVEELEDYCEELKELLED
jgi:hypothetical protein